jgi:hypothetical protein
MELWRRVAGPGGVAENATLELSRITTEALKATWRHHLEAIRQELGIEKATRLERLLIQHVAQCWLRLNIMELEYTLAVGGQHRITEGLYYEKRLTEAQKRYARASESLARVRRLSR